MCMKLFKMLTKRDGQADQSGKNCLLGGVEGILR